MTLMRVRVFTRFERFWHWSQAALILALIFTGAGLHGFHRVLKFGDMLTIHVAAALALMLLWIFAIFWHLTTGQWRHYRPTTEGLGQIIRFYSIGIFRGDPHPFRKTWRRKHNPLQALTYLMLKLVLNPLIWASGLALLLYDLWRKEPWAAGGLEAIATVHAAAAFVMVGFLIMHVYVITTGETVGEQLETMVTGYDRMEIDPAEAEVLKRDGALG
ncbi:MAG: cytochrome b/b6 domain-containing protein [Rhodovulum sp.]|nr:cytochrome b/b6 domain-containing protein [Rhodovulum sp.]